MTKLNLVVLLLDQEQRFVIAGTKELARQPEKLTSAISLGYYLNWVTIPIESYAKINVPIANAFLLPSEVPLSRSSKTATIVDIVFYHIDNTQAISALAEQEKYLQSLKDFAEDLDYRALKLPKNLRSLVRV